jgi:8-oxo-dGTP diphosphatase
MSPPLGKGGAGAPPEVAVRPGGGRGARHLSWFVPTVPASAGALVFDRRGRLLVLKPTYKAGWTIPGGMMEADGETPWETCRREAMEECGLDLTSGRLACVDFLRPRPSRPGGLRFLFDCGTFGDAALAEVQLQAEEIEDHLFVELPDGLRLLSGPVRRRVRAVCERPGHVLYLEDGRPVTGLASGKW